MANRRNNIQDTWYHETDKVKNEIHINQSINQYSTEGNETHRAFYGNILFSNLLIPSSASATKRWGTIVVFSDGLQFYNELCKIERLDYDTGMGIRTEWAKIACDSVAVTKLGLSVYIYDKANRHRRTRNSIS